MRLKCDIFLQGQSLLQALEVSDWIFFDVFEELVFLLELNDHT